MYGSAKINKSGNFAAQTGFVVVISFEMAFFNKRKKK
jgi:hypothetical protein